jgi:hypothetical protein
MDAFPELQNIFFAELQPSQGLVEEISAQFVTEGLSGHPVVITRREQEWSETFVCRI